MNDESATSNKTYTITSYSFRIVKFPSQTNIEAVLLIWNLLVLANKYSTPRNFKLIIYYDLSYQKFRSSNNLFCESNFSEFYNKIRRTNPQLQFAREIKDGRLNFSCKVGTQGKHSREKHFRKTCHTVYSEIYILFRWCLLFDTAANASLAAVFILRANT